MNRSLPSGPALTVAGRLVTYEDLIAAGVEHGRWHQEVARARHAVAVALAGTADAVAIQAASLAFRRSRQLEAGADLARWLDERGIEVGAWRRYLGGRTSGAMPFDLDGPVATVDREELIDALRAQTFASGYWRDQGIEVARGLAAIAESGWPGGSPIREGVAARAGLAARLLDHEVVDGLVGEHALAWTRVRVTGCRLTSLAAGREAVLCAALDGLDPAEVRRRSGGTAIDWESALDELPATVAGRLLCADVGQPVGPIEGPDGIDVLWVVDRQHPDPADPILRSLAAERLVDQQLDAWLVDRLRWIGPT